MGESKGWWSSIKFEFYRKVGNTMTTETMKQIKEMIDINLKVKLELKAEKEGMTYEGLIRKTLFDSLEEN